MEDRLQEFLPRLQGDARFHVWQISKEDYQGLQKIGSRAKK